MTLDDALRDIYRPRIVEMLREHEEWCAANPDAAAFPCCAPERWLEETPAKSVRTNI